MHRHTLLMWPSKWSSSTGFIWLIQCWQIPMHNMCMLLHPIYSWSCTRTLNVLWGLGKEGTADVAEASYQCQRLLQLEGIYITHNPIDVQRECLKRLQIMINDLSSSSCSYLENGADFTLFLSAGHFNSGPWETQGSFWEQDLWAHIHDFTKQHIGIQYVCNWIAVSSTSGVIGLAMYMVKKN